MKTKLIIAAVLATVVAVPAIAQAHVTVQPDSVAAGGFARLDVRVPNETDSAATNKVEVQLPDGFVFASYEPVPGWKVDVKKEKLDQPIESEDGTIDEQVSTITWTATDPAAAIQPGQFRDFGLSVGIPDSAAEGDTLAFPAIQTYDDGEVVRWIGEPDAEHPAAQVSVTAPEADHHGAAAEEEEASEKDDDGASKGLAYAALALGALGLVAGGAALARSRRS